MPHFMNDQPSRGRICRLGHVQTLPAQTLRAQLMSNSVPFAFTTRLTRTGLRDRLFPSPDAGMLQDEPARDRICGARDARHDARQIVFNMNIGGGQSIFAHQVAGAVRAYESLRSASRTRVRL